MPKVNYANILQGVGSAIGSIAEAHQAGSARKILENEKSTPIQKAIAWEALSKGSGVKSYENSLKEKEIQEQKKNDAVLRNELFGTPLPEGPDVGQRAEVGKVPEVKPQYSPVEMANNLRGPGSEVAGPIQSPGLYGEELVTPEARNMVQNANAPTQEYARENAPPPPPQRNIDTMPVDDLIKLRGMTNDKGLLRVIDGKIHQKQEDARNATKFNSALVKGDIKREEEDRAEIRKFSEPYENLPKFDKEVKNLESAQELIDTDQFSADDRFWNTVIQGILENKDAHHIADLLKTPAQQKMFYLLYDQLKPKELGGSNPSTKEVLLSMSKQASQYKGKAANTFITQNMLANVKLERVRAKSILELRVKEPNLSAPEFKAKIDQKVAEAAPAIHEQADFRIMIADAEQAVKNTYIKPGFVPMMDRQGEIYQIPASEVDKQRTANNLVQIKR